MDSYALNWIRVYDTLVVAGIGLLYLSLLAMLRWNLIGWPVLRELRLKVDKLQKRLTAEEVTLRLQADKTPSENRHCQSLIEEARSGLGSVSQMISRMNRFDQLLWSRRQEVIGLPEVHAAESVLIELLPEDHIQAQLVILQPKLRALESETAKGLAAHIDAFLKKEPAQRTGQRALLQEALRLVHEDEEKALDFSIVWHNKTMWLITCGFLLMALLSATTGSALLFLYGALGGFLGRLNHIRKIDKIPSGSAVNWTTLFLSPVIGALAGWSGVLAIDMLSGTGDSGLFLGSAFKNVSWAHPKEHATMAAALVLGFTERFFDLLSPSMETQAQKGSSPQATVVPLPIQTRPANPPADPPEQTPANTPAPEETGGQAAASGAHR